jgi:two-component system cell cycle sensor histidine kinase/response regulator CckA
MTISTTKDANPPRVDVANADRKAIEAGVVVHPREYEALKRSEEALRRSEEQYRVLFDANPQPMWVSELASGMFLAVNDAAVQRYGYSREQFLGMRLDDVHHPEELARLVEFRKKPLAGLPHLGEWRHRTASGKEMAVEVTANIITFGDKTAALALLHDISGRRDAEAALRKSEVQLQQSQKLEAVGKLAGGVAHDFNNLLTAIIGYSDLSLLQLKDDDPVRHNLEEIKTASDRAASLTRQLLAFSRKQILAPKVLDLNLVVRDVHKMLRRLIGEDIDLVINAAADLGKVKADPAQVEQTLLNLAINARDAMPRGGKVVIETANATMDESYALQHAPALAGEYVMVAMTDTGCGMDKETQTRIFEPFFTTKEQGKGTGLGLSTVYGIVKQSGGYIWVYSELGIGTSFKIYLPRLAGAGGAASTKSRLDEGDYRGTETILLVEDEEMLRRIGSLMLESHGYQVLSAANGQDALKLCYENARTIGLVLTDVIMPGMGGRVLAERIAVLCPETPVLFMSGYTDDSIVRHGLLGDQLNFIQKPFTANGLAKKVRGVLDRGRIT